MIGRLYLFDTIREHPWLTALGVLSGIAWFLYGEYKEKGAINPFASELDRVLRDLRSPDADKRRRAHFETNCPAEDFRSAPALCFSSGRATRRSADTPLRAFFLSSR